MHAHRFLFAQRAAKRLYQFQDSLHHDVVLRIDIQGSQPLEAARGQLHRFTGARNDLHAQHVMQHQRMHRRGHLVVSIIAYALDVQVQIHLCRGNQLERTHSGKLARFHVLGNAGYVEHVHGPFQCFT